MSAWVVLLRGVNVGGHRKLPMSDLRALLEKVGCREVQTYLQSGNAVFRGAGAAAGWAKKITGALKKAGFEDVDVFLFSAADWAKKIKNCPYGKKEEPALYLTVLTEKCTAKQMEFCDALASKREGWTIQGSDLYLHLPDGAGRTKLSLSRIEKCAAVRGTARNWRTVQALAELCA